MIMNIDNDIVILRSVFGKVGQSYTFNPCANRQTGMMPDCVRSVNSNGDMILSEQDKQSGKIFIKETEDIVVTDGTVFDLKNPLQLAKWEAIKNSPLIASERFARDKNGDLIVDGGHKKYGIAVLYVERPGQITQHKVSKAKIINKALNFVFSDNIEGHITKCKLLGKNMKNSYPSDVEDYLVEYAKRNPQKIIDLYTGSDTEIRMLFIDAVNKGVIREKDGVFMYGDKIAMGVTDDAVVSFMKQPANQKVVKYITEETYPEFNAEDKAEEVVEEVSIKKSKK